MLALICPVTTEWSRQSRPILNLYKYIKKTVSFFSVTSNNERGEKKTNKELYDVVAVVETVVVAVAVFVS